MRTHKIETAVGQAMIAACIKNVSHKCVDTVIDMAKKGHHLITRRDWNAHLSLSTAKKLQAAGIL